MPIRYRQIENLPWVEKGREWKYILEDALEDRFKPEFGQPYWVIYDNGCITEWTWEGDQTDLLIYAFCNCFPTRELAESASKEVRSLLHEIQLRNYDKS